MPLMTDPTDRQLDELGAAMDEFSRRYKLAMSLDGGTALNELDKLLLIHIHRNPGAGPTDLARFFGVPATTTTSATDRLVKRGFVERRRPEKDRRAVALQVTDAGDASVRAIEVTHRSLYASMLAPLAPDERDTLIRLMTKIIYSET